MPLIFLGGSCFVLLEAVFANQSFFTEKQFDVTDTDMDGRVTLTLDQLVEIVAKI